MTNTLALMLLISGSSAADVDYQSHTPDNIETTVVVTTYDSRPEIRTMTARERLLRRRSALRGGQQSATGGLISLIQTNVAPDCWEFGGTGFSVGSGTGNGLGSGRQNAENLAELIQQTAQPQSWEINGGNGSISIFP